ncbi:MAG TPA: trypsin-like peptidase domain-containing protein [Trebonia sp.]
MEREPAGVNDAGSDAPGPVPPPGAASPRPGPSRRMAVAGVVTVVVLLIAVAVLATRLVSTGTSAAAPSASPSPSASSTAALTVPAIFQRVAPSVVTVRTAKGLGTGVIVSDDGTVLTADHVIAGAKSITLTFADGTVTTATVASADTKLDVATLTPAKLPQPVVPATLGGTAGIGDSVVAVGNPLGLTDSVSAGVVSGLDRTADTDTGQRSGLIQFDASVNPGSSGGPLLDSRGMVVGIVVALADPDGQDAFAGIGFAVPIGSALGGSGGPGQGNEPQI